jgi:hypothetical protein
MKHMALFEFELLPVEDQFVSAETCAPRHGSPGGGRDLSGGRPCRSAGGSCRPAICPSRVDGGAGIAAALNLLVLPKLALRFGKFGANEE